MEGAPILRRPLFFHIDISILGYIIFSEGRYMSHYGNEKLVKNQRLTDIGQLVIFILFMALWIPDIFFGYSNFLNQCLPFAVRLPIGIVLLILAIYTAGTGLYIVFGKDARNRVVRKGVFRFVRHPIYLGEITLYFSLLLINLSLAATGVWVVGTIFLHWISRNEEKQLLENYGKEYEEYMKEVPMWLPRMIR